MENEYQWPEEFDGFPEWQPIDQLQRVEDTAVDRCVHLAEQTWVCYESHTTDGWVDTLTPILGWWAQWGVGGYTESGWSPWVGEKFQQAFEIAAWFMSL